MATIDLTKGPGQYGPEDELLAFADGAAARTVGDRREPPEHLSPKNTAWWFKGFDSVTE